MKQSLLNHKIGSPILSSQLLAYGLSPQLASHYINSGFLKRLGKGAFLRVGDKLILEQALYTLEEHGLYLHVGGKTALAWHGFRHNLPLNDSKVLLFSGYSDLMVEKHIYSPRCKI